MIIFFFKFKIKFGNLNGVVGLVWFDVQPTGENGATRAPISIDLQRDAALSSKAIILQIDNKSQQVSASMEIIPYCCHEYCWWIHLVLIT